MGLTHLQLKLTNLLNRKSVEFKSRVDTGATFMYVTKEIALQLGFDIEEVSQQVGINASYPKLRRLKLVLPIELM